MRIDNEEFIIQKAMTDFWGCIRLFLFIELQLIYYICKGYLYNRLCRSQVKLSKFAIVFLLLTFKTNWNWLLLWELWCGKQSALEKNDHIYCHWDNKQPEVGGMQNKCCCMQGNVIFWKNYYINILRYVYNRRTAHLR